MAADTEPIEILLHLPLLAEDKVCSQCARPSSSQVVTSKCFDIAFVCRMCHMSLYLLRLHLAVLAVFPGR